MVKLKELEKWLSTGQVAKVLGCSRPHAITLAEYGEIKAVRTAAGWLYDPKSVEAYKDR
jgi:excisionase family DNA binding protein